MNTGILLTLFGGVFALLTYLFAPFLTLVEDGITLRAWQLPTGQGALALALLTVALAAWLRRSRQQAAGWGLLALAVGQLVLLAVTWARVWALVPAGALGLVADPQTGGLADGTLVMLDWGFALAAGQAASAVVASGLIVVAHREFRRNQRFLQLTVQWGGQTVLERVLFRPTPVTVGEADDALIQLAAGGLGKHLLLQPVAAERYALHVPAFVHGQLHVAGARTPAAGQSLELAVGDAGILWFDNDVSLIFGFVGAESVTLTAGGATDPGLVVSMAATLAVTFVLLFAMLLGHKSQHSREREEAEAKQQAVIELSLAEPPQLAALPPEPAETPADTPPAPIGPDIDHLPPRPGLPDRPGRTQVARSDKPKGPVDVTALGVAQALAAATVGSALEKVVRGEPGPEGSTSPLIVSGDDPSTEIGGGNPLFHRLRPTGQGGPGESLWETAGADPRGDDSDGLGRRHTVPIGHKPPRKVASYVLASGTTVGGCDKGEIAKQVRARGAMVRACYETQLLSTPTLQGKLAVQWTISGDGSVTGEKVANSTLFDDNRVSDCVLRTIRRIRFQAPDAGTCVIQWPFVFTPG